MKSFSIDISDESTAKFLKTYLTENANSNYKVSLESNNACLNSNCKNSLNSQNDFGKCINEDLRISSGFDDDFYIIYISFTNDSKDNYNNFIYNFSEFIIENYEEHIVDYIINDEYFYFNQNDKECIYNIYLDLKNIAFENECLSSVAKNLNFYFYKGNFINLDGFIYFGIHDFYGKLKSKIEEAVNSFVVEKEYENFLDMLKNYIDTNNSKISRIHLIYLNSMATLLDDNGNEIKLEDISSNYILTDFNFSKNDYVLNTLISLSPREIILHLLSPSDNFINAIKDIFTDRVKICNNCEYCKKYHKSIKSD